MKYEVKVIYRSFVFDNAMDALTFMTMVKEHYVPKDDDRDIEVSMEIIKEE